ncbi:tRNA 2-selenouridine(34) synthase MnmH [Jannaschia pohangensis]|uniref:tRNA 2-selenouridine synthase n=1 Tax=Jannaschia pohangensis TaxID=390807 RepID=A0A1I3N117_9RHOB|nr:tRNA 2-selenouridine(34) synthase MnmH [Jannaschia pohangensis]SFJ02891.1 tRNA 2-selenouridine synthase [Jannaschia pohangensis]
MRLTLTDFAQISALPCDDIIDVRAPAEFAEDHIPGAINLPVLSDDERARVGTIYVQQDRFLARKIGAALVARNAANHIDGPLADRSGGWRPLVYCWRGGQRSGSFASILEQIGWRVALLDGGYKSYRRLVVQMLYDHPLSIRPVLIDGGTGTGKTQLLRHLVAAGAQVIDLEGLANHRGSNFGGRPQGQPSQKMFEGRLAGELTRLDPTRPVFLEAESNAIGEVLLPPSLWKAMAGAEVIDISAPLAARARHLLTAYPDLVDDADLLAERIDSLRHYHARDQITGWHDQAASGDYQSLAEGLIAAHYDPRYRRADRGNCRIGTVTLDDLGEDDLARAAEQILSLV